jgi:hypothetical protein
MDVIKIIIAAILLLFGAYTAVMNWGCVLVSMRNRRKGIDKHHSTVPFVSMIAAGLAHLIYPLQPKQWIGIIPLVDIGNWILIIGLPIALAKGVFRK